MKEGRIFSMEEFAIHDGPGIRTTIFMKGCPLFVNGVIIRKAFLLKRKRSRKAMESSFAGKR